MNFEPRGKFQWGLLGAAVVVNLLFLLSMVDDAIKWLILDHPMATMMGCMAAFVWIVLYRIWEG